jgi:hypothetical protein
MKPARWMIFEIDDLRRVKTGSAGGVEVQALVDCSHHDLGDEEEDSRRDGQPAARRAKRRGRWPKRGQ